MTYTIEIQASLADEWEHVDDTDRARMACDIAQVWEDEGFDVQILDSCGGTWKPELMRQFMAA